MHELAIVESVVELALERAGGRPVTGIRVTVGRLSGVVADSLTFCFDVATVGTPLEGARLDIDEPPGLAHCRTCERDFVLVDLFLLCPCGSADVAVVSGRELALTSLEVG